jgi:hypothetical protein
MHIQRIDSDSKKMHGYQVRTVGRVGYKSKFFSDKKYPSPLHTWAAAKTFMDEYLAEHPEEWQVTKFHQKPSSNNTSGVCGVYFTEMNNRGTRVRYWVAFIPEGPSKQPAWNRRFNVDTYGEDVAKNKAIMFRKTWEEFHKDGKADQFWSSFHHPEYGYDVEAGR